MSQFTLLGFIALGGAFGACSRYLISELCVVLLGRGFPYGTLTVNVIGSLLMGILMSSLNQGLIEAGPWRPIIGLGFLGALTTFSTFSMDNVILMQHGEFIKAGLNILLNVALSITACFIGYQLMMKS
ncbi:fluoride efflux transporter CrcB [Photobacterium profundum]|jgi:fluoride exporter|uniref:Fluoride-specific ion channel FluC n=3 Tax=Photobacterium TaxID=657 RepID=FLUC_PHOPR|nr:MULTISPECIES: fluoride efflux transporter CrcB [Photobacterium]Q6LVY3.1 RecName: Full=Fluoride-specific ion channel FluC [Photobacterium profundum SS9]EAS42773.1 camphor resistance protein CrcB [Photobacterium profundum 3TCK]PSV45577.1 fluoride efflux transporter CrcB [Photobacterium indicum]PSV61045.1 fluoride efflux transporter CrcB [Photobacterium profundum]CAG18542.1 Putative CrcB protein (integral membrane protein possibly involved in chromosome condensation) [Photobacterium profundum 